eukprot:6183854-Pyramimonas_sp.AAC.1
MEALQQEEQARDAPFFIRQRLRKMQRAIQKHGKLWALSCKVLKIRAIEVPRDHVAVETPSAMVAEFRRQWAA